MADDDRIAVLEKHIETLSIKLTETNSQLAVMSARVVQLENAFGTVFCTFASPELKAELLTHLDLVKLDLLEMGLPETTNDLRSLIARGPGLHGPGAQRRA
jgi:hypothetical protein